MNQVDKALHLARRGYPVLPLHAVSNGRCTCPDPGGPKCKPGKHPIGALVPHGSDEATTDESTIQQWWALYPDANIGINLAAACLLVIGPDCPERLADFERRGLPDTWVVQTGSGEGHRHYLYRIPVDCPLHRMCKSGDYDLISNGYIVAAGSITTGVYQSLTPIRDVSDLPIAPDWAVAMLRNEAERKAQRASTTTLGSDDPPVRLSDAAREWWDGKRQAGDRSGTLYAIGKELAKAGLVNEQYVAMALQNRDGALGMNKYSDRSDAWRWYLETAHNAIADVEQERALTVDVDNVHSTPGLKVDIVNLSPAPDDGAGCVIELRRIHDLEQELAAEREARIAAEDFQRLTMRALANDGMSDGVKVTTIVAIFQATSKESRATDCEEPFEPPRIEPGGWVPVYREELAKASGCNVSAVSNRLKVATEAAIIEKRTVRRQRPDTGETISEMQIRISEPTRVIMERLATATRADKRKGPRPDPRPKVCPNHPDGDIIIKRDIYCADPDCDLHLGYLPDIRISAADPEIVNCNIRDSAPRVGTVELRRSNTQFQNGSAARHRNMRHQHAALGD